jgi:hypothetical protein
MGYVYTHLPQNEDIGFDGRSYSASEGLLDHNGRKVLYLYVDASDITFCDRSYASHLASVNVKGYVARWRYGTGEQGETLSEIEPITGEEDRRAITEALRSTVNVSSVHFF